MVQILAEMLSKMVPRVDQTRWSPATFPAKLHHGLVEGQGSQGRSLMHTAKAGTAPCTCFRSLMVISTGTSLPSWQISANQTWQWKI
jgi:hypothetical protein